MGNITPTIQQQPTSFVDHFLNIDPRRLSGWQYGLWSLGTSNGRDMSLFDTNSEFQVPASQRRAYLKESGITICLVRKLLSSNTQLRNRKRKIIHEMMFRIIQRFHRLDPLPSLRCTRSSTHCDGIYHDAMPKMSASVDRVGNLKLILHERYLPWEAGFTIGFGDKFLKETCKFRIDDTIVGRFDIHSFAFHPVFQYFVFGNKTDGKLRVYSFEKTTFESICIATFDNHLKPISCLMFKKNTNFFGTCSRDKVNIWQMNTSLAKCVGTIDMESAYSFAFHPKKNVMAIGDTTGYIHFYLISWDSCDCVKPTYISTLPVHDSAVISLSFHEDGRMLASSNGNNVILCYMKNDFSVATLRKVVIHEKHTEINNLSFCGNHLTTESHPFGTKTYM